MDSFVTFVNAQLRQRQENERLKTIIARIESYDPVVSFHYAWNLFNRGQLLISFEVHEIYTSLRILIFSGNTRWGPWKVSICPLSPRSYITNARLHRQSEKKSIIWRRSETQRRFDEGKQTIMSNDFAKIWCFYFFCFKDYYAACKNPFVIFCFQDRITSKYHCKFYEHSST